MVKMVIFRFAFADLDALLESSGSFVGADVSRFYDRIRGIGARIGMAEPSS